MGEMEGRRCSSPGGWMAKLKPFAGSISVQFGYAGMYIVTSICLRGGLGYSVLAMYRNAVATLAIGPLALILERKVRPKMTASTFFMILALSLFEPVLDQNLYYLGLHYTSATFSSAVLNIVPAVTFLLAVIARLEKVKIREARHQAKVIGTVVALAGAMIMSLYKGPVLHLVSPILAQHASRPSKGDHRWVTGTLVLVASCFSWACFFIVQFVTLRSYPAGLSLAALICLMGTALNAALALIMERNRAAWAIGWDARLAAPVYSGLVNSGITYYIQGMVVKERGPVFLTAFSPLCLIIVAVLGSLILGDVIYTGSVIGAVFIVVGLYSVVWGKRKDEVGNSSASRNREMEELPVSAINSDVVKGVPAFTNPPTTK